MRVAHGREVLRANDIVAPHRRNFAIPTPLLNEFDPKLIATSPWLFVSFVEPRFGLQHFIKHDVSDGVEVILYRKEQSLSSILNVDKIGIHRKVEIERRAFGEPVNEAQRVPAFQNQMLERQIVGKERRKVTLRISSKVISSILSNAPRGAPANVLDPQTRRLPCVRIYISFFSNHLEKSLPPFLPLSSQN